MPPRTHTHSLNMVWYKRKERKKERKKIYVQTHIHELLCCCNLILILKQHQSTAAQKSTNINNISNKKWQKVSTFYFIFIYIFAFFSSFSHFIIILFLVFPCYTFPMILFVMFHLPSISLSLPLTHFFATVNKSHKKMFFFF